MLGRSHALSGWCAGLAMAPVLELHTLTAAIPFAAATAGYAMLPDLDHPGAGASRLFGPVTGALSAGIRAASGALYQATKGPRDERVTGRHRHATHTLLAAVLAGMAASWGGSEGGPWAVFGIILFGLLLAVAALGDWLLVALGGVGLLWLGAQRDLSTAEAVLAGLARIDGWIGMAVALGMFVHCLGDSLTKSGCPWLFPLTIAGERWAEIRPPKLLRFRTGGPVETWLVVPALTVGGVLLVPGAWPVVHSTLSALGG